MNLPVLLIGIGQIVLGLVVALTLTATTRRYRRAAERLGYPTGIFTRTTVTIAAVAIVLIGVITVATAFRP